MIGSVEEIERTFVAMSSAQVEALMVQPLFSRLPDRASGLRTSPSSTVC